MAQEPLRKFDRWRLYALSRRFSQFSCTISGMSDLAEKQIRRERRAIAVTSFNINTEPSISYVWRVIASLLSRSSASSLKPLPPFNSTLLSSAADRRDDAFKK